MARFTESLTKTSRRNDDDAALQVALLDLHIRVIGDLFSPATRLGEGSFSRPRLVSMRNQWALDDSGFIMPT